MEGFNTIDAAPAPAPAPAVTGGAKSSSGKKPVKRNKDALLSKAGILSIVHRKHDGKRAKDAKGSANGNCSMGALQALEAFAKRACTDAVVFVERSMAACGDKHESLSAQAIAMVLRDQNYRFAESKTEGFVMIDGKKRPLVKISRVGRFIRAPFGGKPRRLRSTVKGQDADKIVQRALHDIVVGLINEAWSYAKEKRNTIKIRDVSSALSDARASKKVHEGICSAFKEIRQAEKTRARGKRRTAEKKKLAGGAKKSKSRGRSKSKPRKPAAKKAKKSKSRGRSKSKSRGPSRSRSRSR